MAEVAALITEVLGQKITAQRSDPDSVPSAMQVLRPMLDHYDRIGLRGNSLTLAAILGRQPRTLRIFFEELASREESASSGAMA